MSLLILKYFHILAFVYWLGGDLGTYFASSQVINKDNSPEARAVALKIMLICDMGPKLSMPFIFMFGTQMGYIMEIINMPGWILIALWALTGLWFFNVAMIYFREGTDFAHKLAKFDLWFRILIVIALLCWAIGGLTSGGFSGDWYGWKILVFAALVACGIMIRIRLKPFIPAFVKMMKDGASEKTDSIMHATVMRVRPYVWVIWAGLFLNAAIGLHILG